MRRIRVCQAELERLLLGRLRAKPDCQGVKDITIRAIDHGDADWQVVAIDYGTAEGVTCPCRRPVPSTIRVPNCQSSLPLLNKTQRPASENLHRSGPSEVFGIGALLARHAAARHIADQAHGPSILFSRCRAPHTAI